MTTVEGCADTCVDVRGCSGVLIVDKPVDTSSGYACRKVGRHFGLKKAGQVVPFGDSLSWVMSASFQ